MTEVPHLALTAWADLVLVLPATANTLAKAALGIADNLVGTCVLAATAPVVLVPSMNAAMWQRPAVQRNVAQLRADGYGVVPPVPVLALSTGTLAGRGCRPSRRCWSGPPPTCGPRGGPWLRCAPGTGRGSPRWPPRSASPCSWWRPSRSCARTPTRPPASRPPRSGSASTGPVAIRS
ncbi:hypothetical protein GCM10027614_82550 [Micromonospora vulcania]